MIGDNFVNVFEDKHDIIWGKDNFFCPHCFFGELCTIFAEVFEQKLSSTKNAINVLFFTTSLPRCFLKGMMMSTFSNVLFFCGIVHTLCKIREFKRLQIKGFVSCNNFELEWQRIVLEEQPNEIL